MNDPTSNQFEVHDPEVLARARAIMSATESPRMWAQAVVEAVKRNEECRGDRLDGPTLRVCPREPGSYS